MSRTPINLNALMLLGVTLAGILGALFIGMQAGTGNIKMPLMIFGGIGGLVVMLMLGTRYWLLIAIGSAFAGSISLLPIPFSYAELTTMAAIGLFILHLCLKRAELGFKTSWIDLLLLLNLAWVVVVYLRNPIGFRFAGGGEIGGRAYYAVLLAVGSYLVLSHARVGPVMASRMVWVITIPILLAATINILSQIFPTIGRIVYPFYSAVSIADFRAFESSGDEAGRLTGLADWAKPMMLALCSLYAPVTLIFPSHLWRFGRFFTAWIMIFLSGFRNLVVSALGMMVISTAIRRRWADLPVIFGGGVMALILVIALHTAGMKLPYGLQRALSFIPFVEWSSEATEAADSSAQWRFEMWRDAWNSHEFMDNKVLGDGFGFSAADFNAIMDVELGSGEGFIGGSSQEAWLIRGSFHNGPLSAIRVVGIVGLILFTILIIAMAFASWKLARATLGTPFGSWALYLAIPLVYLPLEFYFIFGAYASALPVTIVTVGYFNFLRLSFDQWKTSNMANVSAPVAAPVISEPPYAVNRLSN